MKKISKQAAMDAQVGKAAKLGCLAIRSLNRIETELGPLTPVSLTVTMPRHLASAMALVCEAALEVDYSKMSMDQALRFVAVTEKQLGEWDGSSKGGHS